MAKRAPKRSEETATTGALVDERLLLTAGREALEQRLGVHGALRFLRLIGGGKDRFEDLRGGWADAPMDDLVAEMREAGLMA